MNLLQAAILGAVQGATEFIPVSSTGHLIIVPWLFGWDDPGLTFDLATHVGTLVALLWFFWRDWAGIASSVAQWLIAPTRCSPQVKQTARMGLWILVGCIPAAIAGVLFNHIVEEKLRNPVIIAAATGLIAFVMLAADRLGRKERLFASTKLTDWAGIGLAQALALVPGVSRSGITISAGLGLGLERESAARCSFLLSAPVIAGAAALHLHKAVSQGLSTAQIQMFLVASAAAAVVGYICIRFLLNFLRTRGLAVFVYYRIILAVIILAIVFKQG